MARCSNHANSVYQGTTPTLVFKCDLDLTLLGDTGKVQVTFAQQGNILFVRNTDTIDIDTEANAILVELSQQETNKLNGKLYLQIQIKMKLEDETVLTSQIMRADVGEIINKEVL